ncbi:3790_t:CDS:2 [Cetraspora pellucida]|uniref:3790_t:CDS:1 n=1 Tax=Cetraspora pellucida TaxID=1433469 RepID=A0ACA9MFI8_9GLOM|nr:3790_t:CDS:2 [Cetraspora pellucida]
MFCEIRWYSLAKVCIGVLAYKQSFQYCLTLSETRCPKYSKIDNNVIKDIIYNKYHFATNDMLMKVVKPVVDAIGRLESNNSTLADIFKELIHIYYELSSLQVPIDGFQEHALAVINKCVREFESNIYFIALFFSPTHKKLAVFKKMNGDKIICASLELAKLFSTLGLVKSKSRNKITLDNLSILRQLRNELKKKVPTKDKKHRTIFEPLIDSNKTLEIFFDEENEMLEDLEKELEKIIIENEAFFMKEPFNFEMFKRDQEALENLPQVNVEQDLFLEENWSVDDIILENL